MNRIMTILSPMFIIGLMKMVFGRVLPPGWLDPAAPQHYPDITSPENLTLRGKLISWVLGKYHLQRISDSDMAMLTLIVVIYSVGYGYVANKVIRERGFGASLNGSIGFVGACVGLVGFARLEHPFNADYLGLAALIVVMSSTLLLVALILLKSWASHEANLFLTGVTRSSLAQKSAAAGGVDHLLAHRRLIKARHIRR